MQGGDLVVTVVVTASRDIRVRKGIVPMNTPDKARQLLDKDKAEAVRLLDDIRESIENTPSDTATWTEVGGMRHAIYLLGVVAEVVQK